MDWNENDGYDEDELIRLMRGIGIGMSSSNEDDMDDPRMNTDDEDPEPGPGPGYIGTEGDVGTALGTGTTTHPLDPNRVSDSAQENLELMLEKLSGLKLS